jgi:hypothetical protein
MGYCSICTPAIRAGEKVARFYLPVGPERIKRGVAVLLSGALAETAELGVYAVTGFVDRVYETTSGRCDCPDATRRAVTHKHQWSARLLSAMSAAAHWERRTLTAKGEAAVAALV